jgi:hypothetical protein
VSVERIPGAGVLIDERGTVAVVPTPTGVPEPENPSIVYRSGQGWDALWSPMPDSGASVVHAEVFHGHFDGARWTATERIAQFDRFRPIGWQSELLAWDEGLVAALSARRAPGLSSGITVLIRDREGWRLSAIPTIGIPRYISMAVRGRRLVIAYSGADSTGPHLETTTSPDGGKTWTTSTRIFSGNAYESRLLARRDGFDLLWLGERELLQISGLHYAHSDSSGERWTLERVAPSFQFDSTTMFDAQSISETASLLVLYAQGGRQSARELGLVWSGMPSVRQLGLVSASGIDLLRSDNVRMPIAMKLAIDRDRAHLFSAYVDTLVPGPVARLTRESLSLACRSTRR